MSKKILKKVARKEITPKEAFDLLYNHKPRNGRFIKLKIMIKDHQWVSGFVNTLFFFPIPISLAKPFIIKGLKEQGLPPDLYEVIKNGSGDSKIIIKTAEVKIKIMIL